jgi:hypothetical protein
MESQYRNLEDHKRYIPENKLTIVWISNLILFKIWGFHGGDYEEYRLLECGAV